MAPKIASPDTCLARIHGECRYKRECKEADGNQWRGDKEHAAGQAAESVARPHANKAASPSETAIFRCS